MEGRWVPVHVFAPTYGLSRVYTGHVYCLHQRRLLDQLNEMFPGAAAESKPFLRVKAGKIYGLRGEKEDVEFACLNKSHILFVREFEEGQTRGLGGKPGYKGYPYVSKSAVAVKIYLPFYALTGHMQCAQGERVSDVLNKEPQFFPLTDVEVNSSLGGRDLSISFIAVNKRQIIFLQERNGNQSNTGAAL